VDARCALFIQGLLNELYKPVASVNKNMTLQQARALAELEKAFTSVGERLRSVQAPPADTVTFEEGVIGDTLKEKEKKSLGT
jgi:hypothetical protein